MNFQKMKSYISCVGLEPVTSLGLNIFKLPKITFSFFIIVKIPPISDRSDKYDFVANISADKMYMVRSE